MIPRTIAVRERPRADPKKAPISDTTRPALATKLMVPHPSRRRNLREGSLPDSGRCATR